MPWISIENPSQELLDKLYQEALKNSSQKCHDCKVDPGKRHKPGCDTAQCSICKGQLLTCDCKNGEPDIWDGMWPGTKECYEKRYVAKWVGSRPFPGFPNSELIFDYNRLSKENLKCNKLIVKMIPTLPRRIHLKYRSKK